MTPEPLTKVGMGVRRRQLLAGTAALLAAPWLRAARAADADDDAVEVEAGVWQLPGRRGLPSPANQGRVGNAGFIVGRGGVMAIDTGISQRHGSDLLAAIGRVTPLPVKLVLVTQPRQEFLFGAGAYQARGIPLHMQRTAAALMAARCENCLKTLRADLGADAMAGTVVPKADVVFDETHVVEAIGRPVLVQSHGHASSAGAASAFDTRTGTLFAGGLVDNGRIPDLHDADLDGWRQALGGLRTLQIGTIVPGHGAAGGPELIGTTLRYLAQLERRCAELLRQGAALSDVPDAALLPEFARWDQADTLHRRNAAIVFLKLEHALLIGKTPS